MGRETTLADPDGNGYVLSAQHAGPEMAPIVDISSVSKRYGDSHALRGIDPVLDSGGVHALLWT